MSGGHPGVREEVGHPGVRGEARMLDRFLLLIGCQDHCLMVPIL